MSMDISFEHHALDLLPAPAMIPIYFQHAFIVGCDDGIASNLDFRAHTIFKLSYLQLENILHVN